VGQGGAWIPRVFKRFDGANLCTERFLWQVIKTTSNRPLKIEPQAVRQGGTVAKKGSIQAGEPFQNPINGAWYPEAKFFRSLLKLAMLLPITPGGMDIFLTTGIMVGASLSSPVNE
jgi:hypothetical protein